MASADYSYGSQPHAARVDSFVGFPGSDLSFGVVGDELEDAGHRKFSFSPPQNDSLSFNAASTAAFSEGLQQTTVHPGVLSGHSLPQADANEDSLSDTFFAPQQLFTDLPNSRRQHGQITPPDDLSPKSNDVKPCLGDNEEAEDEALSVGKIPEEPKIDNKRRRSTKTKANTTYSPRKRGRKNSTTAEMDEAGPEEKTKRDQFLERNRVAAHKCRQKKKEWMVQLDNDYRDLQANNKYLHAEVSMLSGTVFQLKNMLFQHSDCGFSPINTFIKGEAERVNARARFGSDPMVMRAASHASPDAFAQTSPEFSGNQAGFMPVGNEPSFDRASTEPSEYGSLRSRSTAPDGNGMGDAAWADMLQQP